MFDLVFEAEGNARDVRRGHGGLDEVVGVLRENWDTGQLRAIAIGDLDGGLYVYAGAVHRGEGGLGRLWQRASSSGP